MAAGLQARLAIRLAFMAVCCYWVVKEAMGLLNPQSFKVHRNSFRAGGRRPCEAGEEGRSGRPGCGS